MRCGLPRLQRTHSISDQLDGNSEALWGIETRDLGSDRFEAKINSADVREYFETLGLDATWKERLERSLFQLLWAGSRVL